MFQFIGCFLLISKIRWQDVTLAGLPHSEIHESRLTCSSSWLIAADRVLLRFKTPRHPPYALINLTYVFSLLRYFRFILICLGKSFSEENFMTWVHKVSLVLDFLVSSVQFSVNKMVGLSRLELLTSRLSGVRSNQLSYRPIIDAKWCFLCLTVSFSQILRSTYLLVRLPWILLHSLSCAKLSLCLVFPNHGEIFAATRTFSLLVNSHQVESR